MFQNGQDVSLSSATQSYREMTSLPVYRTGRRLAAPKLPCNQSPDELLGRGGRRWGDCGSSCLGESIVVPIIVQRVPSQMWYYYDAVCVPARVFVTN